MGFLKLCNGENIMYPIGELEAGQIPKGPTGERHVFDSLSEHISIMYATLALHKAHRYAHCCAYFAINPLHKPSHFEKCRNMLSKKLGNILKNT